VADLDQMKAALKAAHQAGNKDHAQILADAIRKEESASYSKSVRDQFEAMPMWKKPMVAASDLANLSLDKFTLGGYNKLLNALPFGGYTKEYTDDQTRQAQERAEFPGKLAEAAGTVGLVTRLPTLVPTAMNAVKTPVAKFFAGLMGGAADGALMGAAESSIRGDNIAENLAGDAVSGVAGRIVGGALGKTFDGIENAFQRKPSKLRLDELTAVKNDAYKKVDDARVVFPPSSVDEITAGFDNAIADAYPTRHPQAIASAAKQRAALERKSTAGERKNINLSELDAVRQSITKNVSKMPDPAEADYGRDMTKSLDDWLANVTPDKIVAGDAEEGIAALLKARDYNSRMLKLSQLDESMSKASRRAATNFTVGEDTTMRQNISGILGSPKQRRGFKPDELNDMETVVQGTNSQNFNRKIGKILSPTSGLGFTASAVLGGLGTAAAGPLGGAAGAAIPMVTGALARKASEVSTKKSVDDLLELIANGGVKKPKIKSNEKLKNTMSKLYTLNAVSD
jgi:outer membrane lipoprotein SlyB